MYPLYVHVSQAKRKVTHEAIFKRNKAQENPYKTNLLGEKN